MMDRRLPIAAVLAVLAIPACGGDGDDPSPRAATPSPTPAATPQEREAPVPNAVDPADVRVVRSWADTLRRGDVRGAARLFALPSQVSNGWTPIRLRNRAQVRIFNRSLPCGARLIGTEPAPHGFLYATFRLTERPGAGSCGSGTGNTARTAFRVRDGHITDWLRVPDAADDAPATIS
jgi:hypothetical protein